MHLSGHHLMINYFLSQFRRPISLLGNVFKWSAHRLQTTKTSYIQKPRAGGSFLDRIPANSWDSHMHIVDPTKYALSPDAHSTPSVYTLFDAMRFERTVGLRNIVLVQPSIYGNDNTCMLDALRQLGPVRGRAVVTFEPRTIQTSILEEWHEIGVRGVRVNLCSLGKQIETQELIEILREYADIIRPFDWVLQLYIPLAMTMALEPILPTLGVKVCLDHFGQPTLPKSDNSTSMNPYLVPGFDSLVRLLKGGSMYMKISAPYRIQRDNNQLEALAKEILRVAGHDRVVFATDWPHTRFEGLDIKPFVEQVLNWCGGDEVMIERVFRGNAEELWDVCRPS